MKVPREFWRGVVIAVVVALVVATAYHKRHQIDRALTEAAQFDGQRDGGE